MCKNFCVETAECVGIICLREQFVIIWQVTLTALGEMFEAARSIMSWLGECAKVWIFIT